VKNSFAEIISLNSITCSGSMGIISAGLLQPAPLRIFGANLQKNCLGITKQKKVNSAIFNFWIFKVLVGV